MNEQYGPITLPYQTGASYPVMPGQQNWNPWSFPGSPPNYTPAYDPSTMSLSSDPTALNEFTQQAERTGPSQCNNLPNQQRDTMNTQAKSNAAATTAGQTAQANNRLAMTGGLDSGARERVQTQGNRNLLDM